MSLQLNGPSDVRAFLLDGSASTESRWWYDAKRFLKPEETSPVPIKAFALVDLSIPPPPPPLHVYKQKILVQFCYFEAYKAKHNQT